MTSIVDVSSKLGEYMLKGWVLTDTPCTTKGCNVPLMRSPNGTTPVTFFCANCDGSPDRSQPSDSSSVASSSSHTNSVSRSSTPPTEVSSTLSSPTFALPPETTESRRRREQSDQASAEIGNRLLKGWAMLAEECPNSQCYGVPLVRPPKSGGEKVLRKECVICSGIYISEVDSFGIERLVPFPADVPTPTTRTQHVPPSRANTVSSASLMDTRTILATNSTATALESAARSLELTLLSMSERLTTLVSNPALADPAVLSTISDTIGRTTQALSQVKQLQRGILDGTVLS
ncbi:hypothetical protein D9758_001129 [Tetrapyrgos nigripes]|uniref:Uncharacterized protein n=1 Tax=Tetrapyrgos nigripes TaxID=182062 RepID=A0A8H5LUK1_9AGAR|nr:hypothetical protein D9758_001129 [Tetrapyrgos nigripes]